MPLPATLVTALITAASQAIPEISALLMDRDKPGRIKNLEAAGVALAKIAEATRPANVPAAQWNEQRGIEAVLSSPRAATAAREAITEDYDRLLGMVTRAQKADDDSMDRAAARAATDDSMQKATPILICGALGAAAFVFLSVVVLLVLQTIYTPEKRPMGELVALFITLATTIISFPVAIYAYRFSSSSGSKASGDALRAIAQSKR